MLWFVDGSDGESHSWMLSRNWFSGDALQYEVPLSVLKSQELTNVLNDLHRWRFVP